ncbi:hypothetical protein [Candidatus Sororendozoicomonas aggregata]|uniref:hypothetical protein n=1 Tax=Candidatus Sororendozoicomonas aggregata TaxID=3073239 RepID=UPI002ED67C04
MKKVVFAYHSIDSSQHPAVNGSFPISMDRFKKQISSIIDKGWVAGKTSEIHNENKYNTFYVTGDDGTVDWLNNVLPWCEKNNIPTHTALITGPWQEKPVYPMTHFVQLLLVMRSTEALEMLSRKIKSYIKEEHINYIDKMYGHETLEYRRIIKGAINLIIQPEEAIKLIGEPTLDEEKALHGRFGFPEHYLQYKNAEFGTHTVSHFGVDVNIEKYIKEEVVPNRKHIIDAGLPCTTIFTLPMKPRHGVTNNDLEPFLKENGFTGMYTDEGIWDKKSFVIQRIDAKNIELFIENL